MKKPLVIFGIILAVVVGALAYYTQVYTKSFSPAATVDFTIGQAKIQIVYSRPSKKGREIFGGLVPYGRTWRTGANEPTTFETSADLKFRGKELKAGKYSLWVVPNEQSWQIVFNSEVPSWGVNFDGTAQRNPETDVLITEAPVVNSDQVFEQFTISTENVEDGAELIFAWDKTLVAIPFDTK